MHTLRCSCCNIRPTAGARLHCRCCNIRPVKVNHYFFPWNFPIIFKYGLKIAIKTRSFFIVCLRGATLLTSHDFSYVSLLLSAPNAIQCCLYSQLAGDDKLAPSRTTAVTGNCVLFRTNYSNFVGGERYGRRVPTVASLDIITACN